MEEVVEKNVFDVIIASISGAIGFLYAWIIRLTVGANKTGISLATMIESNKNQSSQIREMNADIKLIKHNLDGMNLALIDQKEMNNKVLIRVNKVLDQLGE